MPEAENFLFQSLRSFSQIPNNPKPPPPPASSFTMAKVFKFVALPLLLLSGAFAVYYIRANEKKAKKTKKRTSGLTDSKIVDAKYTWTIKNFSFRRTMISNESLRSDTFSDGYNLWQLELTTHLELIDVIKRGYSASPYVPIYLILVKSCLPATYAKCQCTIHQEKRYAPSRSFPVSKFEVLTRQHGFKLEDYIDYYWDSESSNDELVLSFTVQSIIIDNHRKPIDDNIREDFNNLERLYHEEKFSDVTFIVGGQEFKAHKIILASESNVFEAMFLSEMKEKTDSKVEIVDMDSATFKQFLLFIYTTEADLKQYGDKLLVAADKYGLEILKSLCEEQLVTDLSVQNAATLFAIADRYSAQELKAEAIKFIEANKPEVIQTPGWEVLCKENPSLVAKLYSSL